MMKPQCLGRGGKVPTRKDSRVSLLMIIQKPKKMRSIRLSVMSVTDPSEGKVTESDTSASQRDRSL